MLSYDDGGDDDDERADDAEKLMMMGSMAIMLLLMMRVVVLKVVGIWLSRWGSGPTALYREAFGDSSRAELPESVNARPSRKHHM